MVRSGASKKKWSVQFIANDFENDHGRTMDAEIEEIGNNSLCNGVVNCLKIVCERF